MWSTILLLFTSLLYFAPLSWAAATILGTDVEGNPVYLEDSRQPALYTNNFGDCQGDSLINVTRFDAAYYRDNMTILFHLAGTTALTNESIMRACEIGLILSEIADIYSQFTSVSMLMARRVLT